jgi:hypothetical protein
MPCDYEPVEVPGAATKRTNENDEDMSNGAASSEELFEVQRLKPLMTDEERLHAACW